MGALKSTSKFLEIAVERFPALSVARTCTDFPLPSSNGTVNVHCTSLFPALAAEVTGSQVEPLSVLYSSSLVPEMSSRHFPATVRVRVSPVPLTLLSVMRAVPAAGLVTSSTGGVLSFWSVQIFFTTERFPALSLPCTVSSVEPERAPS